MRSPSDWATASRPRSRPSPSPTSTSPNLGAVWAIGPFLAACALLAWSGARKIAHPDAARVTLRALRLPSTRASARGLGVVEVLVATLGACFGGFAALVVAGLFVGFAGV